MMNNDRQFPPFHFALGPDEPALSPGSDRWSQPLPMSRHAFGLSPDTQELEAAISYGDYFTASRQFLSKDHGAMLLDAVCSVLGRRVTMVDVDRVAIFLVKHGAFYHPSQVVVDIDQRKLCFVLNVAISPTGQQIIHNEFLSLQQLNADRKQVYWPVVFSFGAGEDDNGRPLPMFLAAWLEGYHEFHISKGPEALSCVVVWDTEHGHYPLTDAQTRSCLRQAACILTYAYHPITYEAIQHWHHAAGDFVIARDDDKVSVRLITARHYGPLMENPEPDVALVLDAMLLFLVEISLKLRLDRIDGVGQVACYGEDGVDAISQGFFQGLEMMAAECGLPDELVFAAKEYIGLHDAKKLAAIGVKILQNAAIHSDERALLEGHLNGHAKALEKAIFG